MEHYYTEQPESKLKIKEISYEVKGLNLMFLTSTSVFSKKKIDFATDLLIRSARIRNDGNLLDLGCGYGVVGITIKKLYPKIKVFMTDINKRAVMLSKRNAELNNVEVKIFQGNLFEPLRKELKPPFFDYILLNPPMSAGRKICMEMINQSHEWLKSKGSLQVVARHKKGGKTLMQYMERVFGNIETIARKKGFHVYYSVK